MEKSANPASRLFAAAALAGAAILVIVVFSSSLGGDSGSDSPVRTSTSEPAAKETRPKFKSDTYVIETGDTLTSIARETGVPVATLLKMNPEVDPQILIDGEKLKLR